MGIRNRCSKAKHRFAERLRKNLTRPEKAMWKCLCSKKLGVWFYSQSIVYGYILDFWCPEAGLAVEVDGPHHLKRKRIAYDKKRDNRLARRGVVTIRFTADMVRLRPRTVVATIKACLEKRMGK